MCWSRHLEPIIKLHSDPQTGCLTGLVHRTGCVPVRDAGCEVGNWHGYFSQSARGGVAVSVTTEHLSLNAERIDATFSVSLPHGRLRVRCVDTVRGGELHRCYSLEALAPSLVGDFVIRLGLDCDSWPRARLDTEAWEHRGANRMRTVSGTKAEDEPGDGAQAELTGATQQLHSRFIGASSRPGLEPLTYLRDEPSGMWIVHHRLLASAAASDAYVLRFRARTWRLSRASTLVRTRALFDALWLRAERRPGMRPLVQIGGVVELRLGERVDMQARVRLVLAPRPDAVAGRA